MKYPVIAECIDSRTGKRFYPGDNFDPAPTDLQLARLTQAGCIARPGAATDPAAAVREAIGGDTLHARSVAQLKDIAAAEMIELGEAKNKPDLIAAIRKARTARGRDGLDGLDVDHLRLLASAVGVTFDDTTDPTTLAASIRQRRAITLIGPDYLRDSLADKPLHEQSRDELLVTAAYEKADVDPTADAATMIAAIELKRASA